MDAQAATETATEEYKSDFCGYYLQCTPGFWSRAISNAAFDLIENNITSYKYISIASPSLMDFRVFRITICIARARREKGSENPCHVSIRINRLTVLLGRKTAVVILTVRTAARPLQRNHPTKKMNDKKKTDRPARSGGLCSNARSDVDGPQLKCALMSPTERLTHSD